jgi:two-component system response regulator PhoP
MAQDVRLRVLYVEGDAAVRETVSAVLTQLMGHTVTVAKSANKLLELLEEDDSFDVVLTDGEMPGMDGMELLQTIRKNPRYAGLPVIVNTDHEHWKERVEKAGGIFAYKSPRLTEALQAALEEAARSKDR